MTQFLENLRQIVNRHEPDADEHALPRAAAVLLLELAATDAGIDERERRVIERAVTERFGLGDAELRDLLEEAGRATRIRCTSSRTSCAPGWRPRCAASSWNGCGESPTPTIGSIGTKSTWSAGSPICSACLTASSCGASIVPRAPTERLRQPV
jgi:hypothetical protein